MCTHQATICFKQTFAQDDSAHEIHFDFAITSTPNIYLADYTVEATAVRLVWQQGGKWSQQFIPVIELMVKDLPCVHTEVKLFRHADTNTRKCDIYR